MASMKDVARLAKVSVSTVSRVMNNNIPVEEKTRLKVLKAIRKLEFKPNLLARGLRSKSGHVIGLAVPEILHPSFNAIIKYVEESVRGEGLQLILGNTHNDLEIEAEFIESLVRRHVDGIIFSRVSDQSRILHVLNNNHVPVVVLDRALDTEDIPTVVLDNYKAGVLAAEHLASLGHRQIVCISGSSNILISRERLGGFTDTLRLHGIELGKDRVHEGNFSYETGIEAVRNFLAEGIEMTAIWAQSDLIAFGAMAELERRGRAVPGDISLMGLDDIEFARISVPGLTTVKQPFQEMCKKAVELIMLQMRKEKLPGKRVVLAPELVVRATTRAVAR
ncbi:MAG: LacI family DNA-binding transcriptional regulator [Spirochaetia bacterium]|jgi:DNA-binding LacI/PurR family transcriptional regulator